MELGPYSPAPSLDEARGVPRLKYRRFHLAWAQCSAGIKPLLERGRSLLPKQAQKKVLVDTRFWPRLRRGEAPCILGWHTDCTLDANAPGPDFHALLQFEWAEGEMCPTLFRDQPVEIGRWALYGREEHSAQRAKAEGSRLLIRVTSSPVIWP